MLSSIESFTVVELETFTSAENIDKIQGLVEEKFKDIKNTDRSCFSFPDQPCTSDHLQVQWLMGTAELVKHYLIKGV